MPRVLGTLEDVKHIYVEQDGEIFARWDSRDPANKAGQVEGLFPKRETEQTGDPSSPSHMWARARQWVGMWAFGGTEARNEWGQQDGRRLGGPRGAPTPPEAPDSYRRVSQQMAGLFRRVAQNLDQQAVWLKK